MLKNLNVHMNHMDSLLNMQISTSRQDALVLPFCSKHVMVTDDIKKRRQKDPAGLKIQDKHFLGPEIELQSSTAETRGLLDSFLRSFQ